jgi:prepilin-type processing-associated H-X9-DG protein
MALFSYAMDNQNRLPTAYIADKEGRPIHSWRTSLLGYMDDFALASKYRWSEPWNGPHNSKLAERPLGFLHCPDDSAPPTETSYMVVVGPRTAFPGSNSRSLEEIEKGDGTSNTILSVEVRESGVNWMQPRDVKFEDAIRGINPRGVLGISSSHEGVVMVCFADGHAVPISVDTSPQVLKQLLQIDDGGPSKFP